MAMPLKYYPQDRNKFDGSIAIKLPMNNSGDSNIPGLFNLSRTTEEQAVSNYVNLLLTRPGERYMLPQYGIGLQLRLFEQNTEGLRSIIKSDILAQSAIWLPYIVNDSVDVKTAEGIGSLSNDPELGIHIKITFRVTEHGANKTLLVFGLGGKTYIEVG